MKIEKRSRKRSHKLDGIGVGRIRTFSFSSDSAYDSVAKLHCRSRKQKQKTQPITRSRIEHCDWFTLPLLLATLTMQGRFPFDQKFRKFWVKSEWKGHFSGISFRNFRCTSRACPNIPDNRNNRKILFHSTIPLGPVSPRPKLSTWLPQCSNVPNPEKLRLVL